MSKRCIKLFSLLLAVSFVFTLTFTGCGDSSSKDASNSAPDASQASSTVAEEAPAEPVTIGYTSFRYEDEATFLKLAEKFHTENPNITVKLDLNKDQNAYYQTLKANIASGENLDTYDIHPTADFVAYAKEGVVADLSDQPFVANLTDGAKQLTTVDGRLYGYNQCVNLICMFYNKELFTKHGVDVPKDWDDFVAISKKLKDEGEAVLHTLEQMLRQSGLPMH